MADYIFLLETRLSGDQLAVVNYLQGVCQEAGLNVYLIGGPMRDLLAGTPIRSLDFSLEGNPLKLQKTLTQGGVELLYSDDDEQSLRLRMRGVRFRVTTAHTENFEKPGRAPLVQPSTIREDLIRRGFTIDAIGLSLNQASRGLLIDPTNGLADIESRLIRVIHNYVFFEDPVRLVRAVRLRTRLGFEFEERTALRMQSAKEGNYLENAFRASLARELEAIAYEPDPATVLKAVEKEGLLEPAFGSGVRTSRMNLAGFAKLPKAIEHLEAAGITADPAPVALQFMLGDLPEKDQSRLSKLPLSKPLLSAWQRLASESKHLQKMLLGKEGSTMAALHALLHRTPAEVVLYLYLTEPQQRVMKRLKDFVARIPQLRQRLPIRELQQMGGSPSSPQFQQVIQTLYEQMLAGKLRNEAELSRALRAEAERAGALPPPAPPKEKEKSARARSEKARAAAPTKPARVAVGGAKRGK